MGTLLFYLVAIISVAAALGMILGRNATYSVLLAVVNIAMVALLYLSLDAPFLAAVQILVYAGAILVLFLFVVMLMGNDPGPLWEHIPLQRPLALLFTLALIIGFVPIVALENVTGQRGPFAGGGAALSDPTALAEALYSRFLLPFEVTSVILLVALIGAVVLGRRDAYHTPRTPEIPELEGSDTVNKPIESL